MKTPADRHTAVRGIIFDMDETLLDTTRAWLKAETELFYMCGGSYDPAVARTYKGMSAYDVGGVICRALQSPDLGPETASERMRHALIDHYHEPIVPMPGAAGLLKLLAGHFTLAVASGSPRPAIEAALATQKWAAYFRLLVSSDEVAHGKPEPDVFFETARRLGLAPADCLVIEDSYHGIMAAKRAGMHCFTVPSHQDERITQTADGVFGSLADITIEAISKL
jgi:HAD superfamily hydrolase (TIGR01509 family)